MLLSPDAVVQKFGNSLFYLSSRKYFEVTEVMLRNVTFKLLFEIGQLLTRLPNIIENCFVILMQILRRKSLSLRM